MIPWHECADACSACACHTIQDANAQRHVYERFKNLATMQDPDVMSMGIDAAAFPDGLPQFVQKDKESQVGHYLNVHMVGVIEHGRKYGLITNPCNVPGGGWYRCMRALL